MAAPDWAHTLLDLAWGEPRDDPEKIKPGGSLYTYMPIGGIQMWQTPVPGASFGATNKHSRETFGVDFRDDKRGAWTVVVAQRQPDPVPAEVMTLDEWKKRH